jgi:hypothetical protein
MLQPTNRLTLIDAMRSPAGFRLESAMAVTFTLDLRALLAAPAAFALTGPDGLTSDGSDQEPIELLHALRSNAGKITVFSQVGEISLPPSRRVFAFLEQCVIPVTAPRGGVVHPKVWVLRYEPSDDQPATERRLRILSASRNLTFDASWDTVVRLDEATTGKRVALSEIGGLFDGLIAQAQIPIASDHLDRVQSLVAALHTAKFALPAGVDDIRAHVLGLATTDSPLPPSADRSLIISPFVNDRFFTHIHRPPVDELVSRPEWLDQLVSKATSHVGTVYSFDDGSMPELAIADDLAADDPGRPLVGLHAKVFAFEQGQQARLFLGSANATDAAFSTNVEILLELVASPAVLGIDRLCDGTDDEVGLRSLFHTYTGPDSSEKTDSSVSLDGARHSIARLAIEGFVEESDDGWTVTYRSVGAVPQVEGAVVHCWPLAAAGHRRLVPPGQPFEARFETSLETMSGFLAFEVSHESGTVTQFVVPVPLTGVPEHRERFLLKALIGNAERFLRYLLALLDEDSTQMDLLDAVERTDGDGEEADGAFNLPVLEKLLRTMRRDPSKLAGLHPLITDLAADDALPSGFADLWATIYDVALAGEAQP